MRKAQIGIRYMSIRKGRGWIRTKRIWIKKGDRTGDQEEIDQDKGRRIGDYGSGSSRTG